MADEDAELVALIDNELDEVAKGRLLTRLAANEALRKRYEELREARSADRRGVRRAHRKSAASPPSRCAPAAERPSRGLRGRSPGSLCANLRRELSVSSWAWAPQPGSR